MHRLLIVMTVLPAFVGPAWADSCTSLVKSMCPGTAVETAAPAPTGRRVLKVEVQPPTYAIGDRFPVEERSLLMNPKRYGLEGSDGAWRYYAMDGVVYKVDATSAQVIEVIRDNRTWGLR